MSLFNPLKDRKKVKSYTTMVQKNHIVKTQIIINQQDNSIMHCQT